MAASSRTSYGPRLFLGYCAEHGLGKPDTAQSISIDKLSALAASLRDAETMVFRLGHSVPDGAVEIARLADEQAQAREGAVE